MKLILAALALLLTWRLGTLVPAEPAAATDRSSTKTSIRAAPGAKTPLRGMAIQLHSGSESFERYNRLIPEIADLGADTVLFVVHGYQTHAGSLDLHIDSQRTASAESLGKLCDLAAVHGLRRVIMPVVLLSSPRNGEWRGKIIPPGHDWDSWFKRYRQFVVHFAKVAERHRVEAMIVGSELIKTENKTEHWRDTIAEIRQHYRGKLGYSANWDHYQTSKIAFWPQLDFVGMTSYYKLADGPNPSIDELDASWRKIKKEIQAFQAEVNKPIVFTEVGWCSQEGAAKEGWNYYANQNATPAGQREQLLLYESFIKAWTQEPNVGVIWWEWNLSEGGANDHGYTPRGKLAETLLRAWFANDGKRTVETHAGTQSPVPSEPNRDKPATVNE